MFILTRNVCMRLKKFGSQHFIDEKSQLLEDDGRLGICLSTTGLNTVDEHSQLTQLMNTVD